MVRAFPFDPVNPEGRDWPKSGCLPGGLVALVVIFRISLFTQSELAWTVDRKLDRYFDGLWLVRLARDLKGRQLLELVLP